MTTWTESQLKFLAATRARSQHSNLVEQLMHRAGQAVPLVPTVPADRRDLILRARLILEEALETISALGVEVLVRAGNAGVAITKPQDPEFKVDLAFAPTAECDLVEVADGCADIKVVTTGTLLACGISDEAIQLAVDLKNLDKFGPGGHRHPETGKWIKPPDWAPPDLLTLLKEMGYATGQSIAAAHS